MSDVVPAVVAVVEPTIDTHSALFNEIYDKIKAAVIGRTINASNLASIAVTAMQIVEAYPKLLGYQKKELVINIICKIIVDLPVTDDTEMLLLSTAKAVLPMLIDTVVAAANGQLTLQTIEEKAKGCFSCFSTKNSS